jgi:hypothetical protein
MGRDGGEYKKKWGKDLEKKKEIEKEREKKVSSCKTIFIIALTIHSSGLRWISGVRIEGKRKKSSVYSVYL